MSFNGKFRGISLKKNGAIVSYTSNVTVGGEVINKEHTVKVSERVSDDFHTIIRSFLGHALIKLGLNSSSLMDDKVMKSRMCVSMPEFKNFDVTKIQIKGDDENEKVFITLSWETPDGEVVNINVPGIHLHTGDYNFENYLNDDISNFIVEAVNYVNDKNYKKSNQLDMFKQEMEEVDEDDF